LLLWLGVLVRAMVWLGLLAGVCVATSKGKGVGLGKTWAALLVRLHARLAHTNTTIQ
jgi:hypothetical protein